MRTYKTIRNDGASVTGWLTNTVRFYLFTNGGSCAQDDAAILAIITAIDNNSSLSRPQKLAQVIAITTATEPPAQEGYHWSLRDCGAQEEQIVVTANPADFVEESGGGEDPGASDPNAPTDSMIFSSQTGNDGGPINQ